MATSNSDQQQRPEKSTPQKWPIRREDYELFDVVGMANDRTLMCVCACCTVYVSYYSTNTA